MSIKEEMAGIERTVDETFDVNRKRDAKRKAQSQKKVYRKALEEVQRIAGNDPMRELAEWIRERIREGDEPPSGRAVRKKGAAICRENGNEVSTGSWLGA